MKILRNSGIVVDMVVSASRLVVIYLLGRTGAPAAAEMNTNVGTCSLEVSWASAIAVPLSQHSVFTRRLKYCMA